MALIIATIGFLGTLIVGVIFAFQAGWLWGLMTVFALMWALGLAIDSGL